MAFGFGDFLGEALDVGKEFIGDVADFATDLGLEDVASLATTGVALSQLFSQPDVPSVGTTSAGKALQQGALITQEQGEAPDIQLGTPEEEDANRQATRAGLRVRRTFDPGAVFGSRTSNPLSIQI